LRIDGALHFKAAASLGPASSDLAMLASAYPVVSGKAQVWVPHPQPAQYMAVQKRQPETTG
jgi:hypothetical protein